MRPDLTHGCDAEFPRALDVRHNLYDKGQLGMTTRYARLDRKDGFYQCCEYSHLSVGWDGNPADDVEAIARIPNVPVGYTSPAAEQMSVMKKRPSTPLRLVPMIVDRFTGLLFSLDRSPTITVEGDNEASDFLNAVIDKTHFWRTWRLARTSGGSMGSALVTVQLREGRFSVKSHPAKIVHDIVWEDADLQTPSGVLIQYFEAREVETFDQKTGRPTGKTKQIYYLNRRIIDEEWDTTFIPAPVSGPDMPDLEIDEHHSYRHGLGRFPGVWIQNLPSDEQFDGVGDCAGVYELADMIDRQLSQANKGLFYNQDPTLVYGRDRMYDQANVPLQKGSERALNVGLGGHAEYLEMSGSAIAAAIELVKFMIQHVLDRTQCVIANPADISGAAQSAKAIEYIFAAMLEKAAILREQYGAAIITICGIILELARKYADPLAYRGRVEIALFDLDPRLEERDLDPHNPDPEVGRTYELVPRTPGVGGRVSLAWGAYFPATAVDARDRLQNLATAYKSEGLDHETFVRLLAPLFGIRDIDGLLRSIRTERQLREEKLGMHDDGFDLARDYETRFADSASADAAETASTPAPAAETGQPRESVILNGAQITAAKDIVQDVSIGKLPKETGIAMLINLLGITPEGAAEIMDPVEIHEIPPDKLDEVLAE